MQTIVSVIVSVIVNLKSKNFDFKLTITFVIVTLNSVRTKLKECKYLTKQTWCTINKMLSIKYQYILGYFRAQLLSCSMAMKQNCQLLLRGSNIDYTIDCIT